MSWDVILIKTETNMEPIEEIEEPVPVSRVDFVNVVRELAPDAKICEDEQIILDRPTFSVEIMIEDEFLDAISLAVRGGEAPLGLLAALCGRLDCRAYDTSLDEFIDFESLRRGGESGFEQWKKYRDKVLGTIRQT